MQEKLWSKRFAAIVSSNLLMAWAFYALMPTLPICLTRDLRISQADTGLVLATFSIAAILIRPLAGYLVDNYHRFLVFILSLTLMTAVYGIYPLVNGVVAMILLRFMHGGMWGICSSATAPIVADTAPVTRLGEGMGIYALSVPVAMTIGPMFGLEILKELGSDVMFFSIFGISFLSLLIAFFAKTPSKTIIRKKFALTNLFHRKALPLSLCMFFLMIAYGSIVIFVGVYAEQKGFSNVATFFLCFAATLFLSRVFLGKLFDRGYVFQLILVGLVLTAIGMPCLGYARNQTQFLVAGIINGFGFGVLLPTHQAAINNLVDSSERGAANSTYLVSYDLALGAASLLIGFLSDKIVLGDIYAYSLFLIILSAGIFVFNAYPHYHRNILNNNTTTSS
jgi:MFS family permease